MTRTTRRVLWLVVMSVALWFLLVGGLSGLRTYVVQSYKIPSGSMEPTILVGDHVMVDKRTYRVRAPKRGELAVFRFPEDPSREFVSRVVAVPGDTLEIRDKALFLAGKPVEEPFAVHIDPFIIPRSTERFATRDNFGPLTIPPDHYFVMGDNRDNAFDSRFWGPVERSLFTGGPGMWIYWSWDAEKRATRWDRAGRSLR
ncbi:MAG TPA: signal peptidase I [Thermoanaerobaculia bacterium]|nr:signal peptidase I [Thermoanaerobaculia bacterium]